MNTPNTKYTKINDVNIAYQVFGSGPVDLVYIPGWISNIDYMWACPDLVHFFKELGKVARVIIFDKRGTGLSDRVVEQSTLEERMEDITAVMDATGSEKAILFGHSEGGSVSALYSAIYPNRVISLIAFGIFAKRRFSKSYPWAPTNKERQKLYHMIENSWGGGDMQLEALAPSKANDKQFMHWLASYFRYGASPQAALKLTKMNTEVNIMGILKYIKVPTLLMQRTHDIDVKIEEGKFIAKHIQGAKFIEFDGADHLFWAGNTQEVLDEITAFIKNRKPIKEPVRGLLSILFGQLLTTTIKSGNNYKLINELINFHGGTLICEQDEKFFSARFETPMKAINCGLALQEAIKAINNSAAFGVCLRETTENNKIQFSERDNFILKSLKLQLKSSKTLITPTVKHLLSGAPLNFTPESAILANDSLDICKLYSVTEKTKLAPTKQPEESLQFSEYNFFLENVVHVINEHLENDAFTVEVLSEKMGLSERQLQRRIKETTGKSPSQLITALRLKKAKVILLSNAYTVAEIAFRFGFSCPSYFSKCFKKEFGRQPTALLQEV